MMPNFIRGVINLRGNVIPVVDLAARLGRPCSSLTKKSCILLVETTHQDQVLPVGMLVDDVYEIVEIAQEDIQPAPSFGSQIRVEFIQAMGRIGEQFVILLALEQLLSVGELAVVDKMAHAPRVSHVTDALPAQLTT